MNSESEVTEGSKEEVEALIGKARAFALLRTGQEEKREGERGREANAIGERVKRYPLAAAMAF